MESSRSASAASSHHAAWPVYNMTVAKTHPNVTTDGNITAPPATLSPEAVLALFRTPQQHAGEEGCYLRHITDDDTMNNNNNNNNKNTDGMYKDALADVHCILRGATTRSPSCSRSRSSSSAGGCADDKDKNGLVAVLRVSLYFSGCVLPFPSVLAVLQGMMEVIHRVAAEIRATYSTSSIKLNNDENTDNNDNDNSDKEVTILVHYDTLGFDQCGLCGAALNALLGGLLLQSGCSVEQLAVQQQCSPPRLPRLAGAGGASFSPLTHHNNNNDSEQSPNANDSTSSSNNKIAVVVAAVDTIDLSFNALEGSDTAIAAGRLQAYATRAPTLTGIATMTGNNNSSGKTTIHTLAEQQNDHPLSAEGAGRAPRRLRSLLLRGCRGITTDHCLELYNCVSDALDVTESVVTLIEEVPPPEYDLDANAYSWLQFLAALEEHIVQHRIGVIAENIVRATSASVVREDERVHHDNDEEEELEELKPTKVMDEDNNNDANSAKEKEEGISDREGTGEANAEEDEELLRQQEQQLVDIPALHSESISEGLVHVGRDILQDPSAAAFTDRYPYAALVTGVSFFWDPAEGAEEPITVAEDIKVERSVERDGNNNNKGAQSPPESNFELTKVPQQTTPEVTPRRQRPSNSPSSSNARHSPSASRSPHKTGVPITVSPQKTRSAITTSASDNSAQASISRQSSPSPIVPSAATATADMHVPPPARLQHHDPTTIAALAAPQAATPSTSAIGAEFPQRRRRVLQPVHTPATMPAPVSDVTGGTSDNNKDNTAETTSTNIDGGCLNPLASPSRQRHDYREECTPSDTIVWSDKRKSTGATVDNDMCTPLRPLTGTTLVLEATAAPGGVPSLQEGSHHSHSSGRVSSNSPCAAMCATPPGPSGKTLSVSSRGSRRRSTTPTEMTQYQLHELQQLLQLQQQLQQQEQQGESLPPGVTHVSAPAPLAGQYVTRSLATAVATHVPQSAASLARAIASCRTATVPTVVAVSSVPMPNRRRKGAAEGARSQSTATTATTTVEDGEITRSTSASSQQQTHTQHQAQEPAYMLNDYRRVTYDPKTGQARTSAATSITKVRLNAQGPLHLAFDPANTYTLGSEDNDATTATGNNTMIYPPQTDYPQTKSVTEQTRLEKYRNRVVSQIKTSPLFTIASVQRQQQQARAGGPVTVDFSPRGKADPPQRVAPYSPTACRQQQPIQTTCLHPSHSPPQPQPEEPPQCQQQAVQRPVRASSAPRRSGARNFTPLLRSATPVLGSAGASATPRDAYYFVPKQSQRVAPVKQGGGASTTKKKKSSSKKQKQTKTTSDTAVPETTTTTTSPLTSSGPHVEKDVVAAVLDRAAPSAARSTASSRAHRDELQRLCDAVRARGQRATTPTASSTGATTTASSSGNNNTNNAKKSAVDASTVVVPPMLPHPTTAHKQQKRAPLRTSNPNQQQRPGTKAAPNAPAQGQRIVTTNTNNNIYVNNNNIMPATEFYQMLHQPRPAAVPVATSSRRADSRSVSPAVRYQPSASPQPTTPIGMRDGRESKDSNTNINAITVKKSSEPCIPPQRQQLNIPRSASASHSHSHPTSSREGSSTPCITAVGASLQPPTSVAVPVSGSRTPRRK